MAKSIQERARAATAKQGAPADSDRLYYRALISDMADAEPSHGWTWRDLPELTPADRAVICRVLADEVGDRIDVTDLVADCAAGRNPAARLPSMIEEACLQAVWYDVQCACEQRQIERDRKRLLRHPESVEAEHGVAGQFR